VSGSCESDGSRAASVGVGGKGGFGDWLRSNSGMATAGTSGGGIWEMIGSGGGWGTGESIGFVILLVGERNIDVPSVLGGVEQKDRGCRGGSYRCGRRGHGRLMVKEWKGCRSEEWGGVVLVEE
jgi:hypothetical protein